MYEYTGCGLPGIYLCNGYVEKDTPYGHGVSIQNIEGLHDAIGLHVIRNEPCLNDKEIRFLRIEMDLSQNNMARLLSVNESTIRNWEAGRQNINGAADKLLRVLYKEFATGDGHIRKLVDRIGELNRGKENQGFHLELSANSAGVWQAAA